MVSGSWETNEINPIVFIDNSQEGIPEHGKEQKILGKIEVSFSVEAIKLEVWKKESCWDSQAHYQKRKSCTEGTLNTYRRSLYYIHLKMDQCKYMNSKK